MTQGLANKLVTDTIKLVRPLVSVYRIVLFFSDSIASINCLIFMTDSLFAVVTPSGKRSERRQQRLPKRQLYTHVVPLALGYESRQVF